ncbi:hypothetical protein TREMEDRAFT_32307 [Tremella mesenterica DSM 1558]|uniref:uncharacterized protein n=1 Tax=Tremella mesenterica (strain ATCC 24925 / CBS 8224 / DSM 1558 / NBRC 9311 / NRRL Y-6157 / RJB 2259-6 / UBC 559-6) TaxID=578456 RepID=UPI0003F49497|nr:uncharacterized protein TREMEDRAFT_32307 [Tremella mesenterica DSM 1558]EIW68459.1 hypothetical protein TREMEDRAFT_32307 [Tremella mesenterica DSM 1558]
MSTINLRPVITNDTNRIRPIPSPTLLSPWKFDYASSPSGKDLNLLIMFHGLGQSYVTLSPFNSFSPTSSLTLLCDTKQPFFNLGKSLNLPHTAILSLQAPDPIPLMENPSYSWYDTFDPFFNPLPSPSPTKHLSRLLELLSILTSTEPQGLGWEMNKIHLFGWGQGGSMVLEIGYENEKDENKRKSEKSENVRLGSITSICASLLSHPTTQMNLSTPICLFTRIDPRSAKGKKEESVLRRAFKVVRIVRPLTAISLRRVDGEGGEDMPKGKEEWMEIMRFWGQVLYREQNWGGEVYEVVR